MKQLVLAIIVGVAAVGALPVAPSRNYRSEDNKGNYAFSYSAHDSSSFHEETGSPGVKLGSYGVTEPDGKQRVVNYIADENGFRAQVEVKDAEPLEAAPSVLVAQSQPTIVEAAPEKASRKADQEVTVETADTVRVEEPVHKAETEVHPPGEPVPAHQIDGQVIQPPQTPQHVPTENVRPQDLPATVFFLAIPQQFAYSKVQSYSVNGFVPVSSGQVMPSIQQLQSHPSLYHELQGPSVGGGVRPQIPQVPRVPILSWQYLARPQIPPQYPAVQQVVPQVVSQMVSQVVPQVVPQMVPIFTM